MILSDFAQNLIIKCLKLDMSKVYGIIEWEFFRSILRKMGFSEKWVHLVLQCVSTVSYNIVHGDKDLGPIIPRRGIRKGDPLSPYLFIICAEGLLALICKYESKQWIPGVKVCRKAPVIFHMLFSDDNYFYCKAEIGEASRVLELLATYEKASGQKINANKFSIFFSNNVIQYNRNEVSQVLGMDEADEHSKYIGFPNTLRRNKSVLLGYLKEKVKLRIRSWNGKVVSRSGKEILIKLVAQSLPTFAMNVFLLPLDITRR